MKKFFPWRIFRKVYFYYLVLQTTLGLGVAVVLWGPAVWQMDQWANLNVSAHSVIVFAVLNFLGALLIGLWLTMSFLLPLRQALLKVKSLANKKFRKSLENLSFGDIRIENLGEFSDLENQLNQIYRKLKVKNNKIAREKEELNALMSSISDSILAVGVDRRLLYYNTKYRDLFLGRDYEKGSVLLKDIEFSPAVLVAFEKALVEGQPCRTSVECMTRSGDRSEFNLSVAPLFQRKNGGPVYGAIAVFHDMTEIRLTQQIKSEFVANASHELRTPMTSLKGYVMTLKEDIEARRYDDVGKFVEIISGNVDRLVALTNDLLTISRLENGSDLNIETVSTAEIEAIVRREFADNLQRKGHQLNFEAGDVFDFQGDALKIQQVVLNLVGNAIKYMPDPGQIWVVWKRGIDGIELEVRDTGPGISEEHLPRLFERFYRIDKGRARTDGGTGLGLAIVKHIVSSHGGSVFVDSEIGHGSTFRCFFPQFEKPLHKDVELTH